jgi:hypothetical protein
MQIRPSRFFFNSRPRGRVGLCALIALIYFAAGCTHTRHYYVDDNHLKKAMAAPEATSIPAYDENGKRVVVEIPNALSRKIVIGFIHNKNENTPIFKMVVEDGEACIRPEGANPEIPCFPLKELTFKEHTNLRGCGWTSLGAAGVAFGLMTAVAITMAMENKDDDCNPECRGNDGFAGLFVIIPGIAGLTAAATGGLLIWLGQPSDRQEVDRASPGFPQRLDASRNRPLGLSYKFSF